MDNKLKLLISLYEEEKIQLQKRIEECLAESEYLMAHYHSQALGHLNGRLQTLNKIEDKLHDQKEFWQEEINRLRKGMENEDSVHLKEYYVKALLKARKRLQQLNQVPKQTVPADSITLLDETFARLLDKKITNLKLMLKKSGNLFLRIAYSKNILQVDLPYVKQHIEKWMFYDENLNSFKKLGFDFSNNESKLTLTLTGSKDEILHRLKIIISKIVFEIFYFKEFKNESYIQFTERNRP